MPEERRANIVQWARCKPAVLLCRCGAHMYVWLDGEIHRAVCYEKECEHYRRVFEVEYPTVLIASYTDTPKLI